MNRADIATQITGLPAYQAGQTIQVLDTDGWRYLTTYESDLLDAEVSKRESEAANAQKISAIEKAIQAKLDKEARAKGYDSILSACSYAGYTNPFQAEGQAFIQWRGSVWKYCYDQLAEIEAGNRSEPTLDEFLAELPAYVPPA